MNTLASQLRQLAADLDEMGFNGDDSINGGDTVDVVGNHMGTINKLPEVAAVLEAAQQLVKGKGRFHTEQNYNALRDAVKAIKP